LAEMCSAVLRRRAPSRSILVGCIFVTGIVFASAEVAPSFERVLEAMWGALASPRDAISGSSSPVTMVADPSDLVAMPALWVAWRVAARRRLPSDSDEEEFQTDRSLAGSGNKAPMAYTRVSRPGWSRAGVLVWGGRNDDMATKRNTKDGVRDPLNSLDHKGHQAAEGRED